MLKDYFLLIFRNFSRRKLRGWLTILGILIGVAAVVALISVAQGMQDAISEQFEQLGSNKLMVMPGGAGAYFGAFAAGELTKDDLEVIEKVEGVDIAAEMFYKTGKVSFGDETKHTFIIGLPTDESFTIIEDMQGFEAEKGRQIMEGDKYETTIGWLVWNDDFFEKPVRLRDKIEIEGQEFKVIGLISKIGTRADDTQIYVPMETAREIFNEPDEISAIYIQIKDTYTPDEVASEIKKDLRDFRDEEEGDETFNVQTFEQILEQVNTVLGIVGTVLVVIALISLVVGGVGIMNTMYTSVLERTREIGIMKSVGAKNHQILILFTLESGFYGVVGGAIGVILGILMGKGAELAAAAAGYPLLKVAVSFSLIAGALFFSFLVGAVSGVAPARAASRLSPVEALRYE